MNTYIHTYVHTYIHTYIHTYTRIQDSYAADVFGVPAIVTRQKGSLLTIAVQVWAKNGDELLPKRYDVDVNDVILVTGKEMKPIIKKNLSTLTTGEKRFMIKQVWGNHAPDKLASGNSMLSDTHLRAAYEYYQRQYQAQELRLASASMVTHILTEGVDTPAGSLALATMKEEMHASKIYILPVHSETPLHWTFITIKKAQQGTDEIESVEYTDWLLGVESNRFKAEVLWAMLSDYKHGELPQHANRYRQRRGSNDCGLAGVWLMERCCRELRGEGTMRIYPNAKGLREQLAATLRVLITAHEKWRLEDALGKGAKVIIDIPGAVIPDKKQYAEKVKDLSSQGKLITQKEKFYTCSKCRWTPTGEGCVNCNPARHEKLLKEKLIEAEKLKIAVELALKAAGLASKWKPSKTPIEENPSGGGEHGTTAGLVSIS